MLSTESSNIYYLQGFMEFQGHTIKSPTSRIDYIRLCRRFLCEDDYSGFMKAIFDTDQYNVSNTYIRNLVDAYYSYPGAP